MSKETDEFIKCFREMAKAYNEKDKKDVRIKELEQRVKYLNGGLILLACYIFAIQIKNKSKNGPIELLGSAAQPEIKKWIDEISKKVLPNKNEDYMGGMFYKISKLDPYSEPYGSVPNHGWTNVNCFVRDLKEEACKVFKEYNGSFKKNV